MTIFSNKTNEYFCDRLHCWKTPPLLIVSRNKGNIYIRDKFFKHISTNKNRTSTRPTLPSNFLLRAGCLLRQTPPPYFCKIRREFAFKLKSGRREVRARVTLLFVASRTVVHLDGRCSWNIYPLDSRVSTRCSTNPVTLFLLQKISKRVRLSFHSWNEIFQFRWRNLFDRRNNINKTRFISIRFRIEKCRGYISLSLSRVSIFRSKFVQIFFFSRFWLTNITTLDNEIRFLSR